MKIQVFRDSNSKKFERLLEKRQIHLIKATAIVKPILDKVQTRGDRALLEYAHKFDGLPKKIKTFEIPKSKLKKAWEEVSESFKKALEQSSENIRRYAKAQKPKEWLEAVDTGITLGQIVRPLEQVGCYVPGGRFPLPSTLLMTVIPAQVAGVKEISVATPSDSNETWASAYFLKVNRVFRLGGAQAIAAFAYGTGTVPKVDRIVGPGNVFVAAAKKLLAGQCAIDFVAGPTEVVIISEEGDPKYIAADMLAQAEHDLHAFAILITPNEGLAKKVILEIKRQGKALPKGNIAARSIARNGAIVIVRDLDEAIELSNHVAPEHLVLPDRKLVAKVANAGSVFIGDYSPEAAGDYACGPNHVLPTNGFSRVRGGLSVLDYLKIITVQELSRQGLNTLRSTITTLARAEGLEAHARSVEIRLS